MTADAIHTPFDYINWLLGPGQPQLIFWVLSAVILVSAIGVVSARNLVHAAMLLALCFVAVGGIFILQNAEFLAAVQVLVYAGGIVTLIIFAIMLSESITGKKIVTQNRQSVAALAVAVMMAIVMVAILLYDREGQFVGPMRWWLTPERNEFPAESNVQLIGRSLMSTYTLAFWIASIILMVAMIGSLILARSEKDDNEEETAVKGSETVSAAEISASEDEKVTEEKEETEDTE